ARENEMRLRDLSPPRVRVGCQVLRGKISSLALLHFDYFERAVRIHQPERNQCARGIQTWGRIQSHRIQPIDFSRPRHAVQQRTEMFLCVEYFVVGDFADHCYSSSISLKST